MRGKSNSRPTKRDYTSDAKFCRLCYASATMHTFDSIIKLNWASSIEKPIDQKSSPFKPKKKKRIAIEPVKTDG